MSLRPDQIRNIIELLDHEELKILKYRCEGLDYKDIASKMYLSEDAIKRKMPEIQKKFGIRSRSGIENYNELIHKVCPILEKMDRENDGFDEYSSNVERKRVKETPEPDNYLEVERNLNQPPTQSTRRIQPRTTRGNNIFLFIFIVIVGIIGLIIINNLVNGPTQNLGNGAENGAQNQTAVSATLEQGDDVSFSSTATNSQVIQPTEPEYLFYDDFETGLDPRWNIIRGELGVTQGNLTILTPYGTNAGQIHIALVDGLILTDFRVELHIEHFLDPGKDVGVFLRYNEDLGGVGVLIGSSTHSIWLATIDPDGTWTPIPGSDGESNLGGGATIEIEVEGNNYTVYYKGERSTYATIPGPEAGLVGLRLINSSSPSKNSYAPKISYFKIEELP